MRQFLFAGAFVTLFAVTGVHAAAPTLTPLQKIRPVHSDLWLHLDGTFACSTTREDVLIKALVHLQTDVLIPPASAPIPPALDLRAIIENATGTGVTSKQTYLGIGAMHDLSKFVPGESKSGVIVLHMIELMKSTLPSPCSAEVPLNVTFDANGLVTGATVGAPPVPVS